MFLKTSTYKTFFCYFIIHNLNSKNMDLEMDCDYLDDPIEEYLRNKLKLLKASIKYEEDITKSFEINFEEVLKNKLQQKNQTSKVNKHWKYVYEYKFILGFELDSDTSVIIDENKINVLLEFNPPTSPLYKIEKFKVGTSIIFILIVDNLDFTKYSEYDIKGIIRSHDETCELIIKDITVKGSDFYDTSLSLKDCYYNKENPKAFLSFLSLNNEIILKCETRKSFFKNLISNIRSINIDEKTVYYLIKDELLSIDGSVFKLHEGKIHLYYRSRNQLIILLHYLYKNVKNFNIDLNLTSGNGSQAENEDLGRILQDLTKTAFNFHQNTIERNHSPNALNEEYKVCRESLMKYENIFNSKS